VKRRGCKEENSKEKIKQQEDKEEPEILLQKLLI
jgi:hypothetical protein